jgi:hypothetical protein
VRHCSRKNPLCCRLDHTDLIQVAENKAVDNWDHTVEAGSAVHDGASWDIPPSGHFHQILPLPSILQCEVPVLILSV